MTRCVNCRSAWDRHPLASSPLLRRLPQPGHPRLRRPGHQLVVHHTGDGQPLEHAHPGLPQALDVLASGPGHHSAGPTGLADEPAAGGVHRVLHRREYRRSSDTYRPARVPHVPPPVHGPFPVSTDTWSEPAPACPRATSWPPSLHQQPGGLIDRCPSWCAPFLHPVRRGLPTHAEAASAIRDVSGAPGLRLGHAFPFRQRTGRKQTTQHDSGEDEGPSHHVPDLPHRHCRPHVGRRRTPPAGDGRQALPGDTRPRRRAPAHAGTGTGS